MKRSLVPAVALALAAGLGGCSGSTAAESSGTVSIAAPTLATAAGTTSDVPVTAQNTTASSSAATTTSTSPGTTSSGPQTVTRTVTSSATMTGISPTATAAPQTSHPAPAPKPPAAPAVPRTTSVDVAYFMSPSGGVECTLSGDRAACEALDPRFTPPAKPSTCEWEYGRQVEMQAGGPAAFRCASDVVYLSGIPQHWWDATDGHPQGIPSEPALAYGHTLTTDLVSCSVDRATGVTCRRLDGSHGFTLSRDAYRTW